ncbi:MULTISPECIES: TetR/AcrR family transcriptional regulator [Alteromonas]|jgi:AcrR family transcriptional regulator|uniref:Transcriptional regulator n=3 Tax=Alteromonas mediterranea TaxID=314275 RepID=A0AAC8XLB4_9ALTE|nr:MULTISPECIES: TetR/AcrR family transcriptional regulator [Alteromonas]AGP78505.1 transcriptional regulator PhaD [Alteromonas mediterranea 615]AGP94169.1 transcriptional regulator PhaD [Alteromonas mediterranea U8]MBR9782797.1 TetR/AcrR family transcriptional regulator [Gammaproteobacteria bacterium]MEA3381781.1 TetR/AcrR family transcriptional regulator [Pseudomonadota bacterium]AEA98562.1 transcriptional regulator [Alteromonas mediterranea DE]|tara:strand:+ start:2583 stop:3248 length:666 start_codon:yes stop_codon:yes gene_type:complete
MKTAQKILLTALTLFNEHGENTVTSVDIALELDISPGNLYYHFKGKDSLVSALMKMHEQQMQKVLNRDKLNTLHPEEIMVYLYLLIDSIHVFRFFYRSPADLAEKYPAIVRPRQHIITRLNKQLAFLFDSLSQRDMLIASKTDRALLVDLISLIITQSCQFDELNSHMDSTMQRYHALSLMMVSVLPRLALSDEQKKQLEQILNSQDFVRGSATHSPLDFA